MIFKLSQRILVWLWLASNWYSEYNHGLMLFTGLQWPISKIDCQKSSLLGKSQNPNSIFSPEESLPRDFCDPLTLLYGSYIFFIGKLPCNFFYSGRLLHYLLANLPIVY